MRKDHSLANPGEEQHFPVARNGGRIHRFIPMALFFLAPFLGFFKSIARPFHLENLAAMGQPLTEKLGYPRIPNHPFQKKRRRQKLGITCQYLSFITYCDILRLSQFRRKLRYPLKLALNLMEFRLQIPCQYHNLLKILYIKRILHCFRYRQRLRYIEDIPTEYR